VEFAAHHQRCDYCGWPQEVTPGTPEADELILDRAIADLSDAVLPGHLKDGVPRALQTIGRICKGSGRGKRAIATIIDLLQVRAAEKDAWFVLAVMGAVEAVPLLLQRINALPDAYRVCSPLGTALAMLAPEAVLPLCREAIEASGKNLGDDGGRNPRLGRLRCALATTKFVGKPAIPMLLEFCGLFAGQRGKECQDTVDAIFKNGRMTWTHIDNDGGLHSGWIQADI
jgi:hypothetical protein